MKVSEAYNVWAEQYDTNLNKTRDLEAVSLRETLGEIEFKNCLEIGCGTGKNTEFLVTQAKEIVAADFSEEMLAKAKEKILSEKVLFRRADINGDWTFADRKFDLITFSLVLEHIEDLESIFRKASEAIETDGFVYIGELHPFKQYTGTKARFETSDGVQILECYTHHVSDFTDNAAKFGFKVEKIREYFDDADRSTIPRILTILFKKFN